MKAESFNCRYLYAAGTDIGMRRSSNQDEVICCPDEGFFAVSDGMGGLLGGGDTSKMITQVLPLMIRKAAQELKKSPSPEMAAKLLSDTVRGMSDNLYNTLNNEGSIQFGATLCGVWLIDGHAVFINLGDSRGYRLGFYKKNIKQITIDHNIASYLVASGELTPAQARRHPSRAQLTRFVGMDSPAEPEVTVIPVQRGDYLLLCSDGVYGMLPDICLPELLRSSKSPERVVENITQAANTEGGKDNIAVVYLKILG